jgi:hypothetical protein
MKNENTNPERVIKRKSYYGFARKYPGSAPGSYLIGDSLKVKRNQTLKKVLGAIILFLIFALSYILTTAALIISETMI